MSNSGGLSIKNLYDASNDPLHGENGESPNRVAKDIENSDPHQFYGLCENKPCCLGKLKCGHFKQKSHSFICALITTMITCLFFAVIVPLVLYRIADDTVNTEVVIDSTSAPNYDIWKTNACGKGAEDIKITYDLHYFGVQNPTDFLNGAKPILAEIGPYAYDEYFNKFDIEWSDGGDTVTFYTHRYYVFNQARSGPGLTEQDEFLIPNPVVSGFQFYLAKIPSQITDMVEVGIISKLQQSQAALNEVFTSLDDAIDQLRLPITPNMKEALHAQVDSLNATAMGLYQDIYTFVYQSNPADLLTKTLLCNTPYGVSPLYQANPSTGWFGWLNDPLLLEVTAIVNVIQNMTGMYIPWTAAVPGVTPNYTSIEEVRRRKMPETFKTGQKNPNQVGQYVKYNNMKSMWSCISPMDSQDPDEYTEGVQFPACAHFNESWTNAEATEAGYVQPFATPYSNRVQGTDANMFGRPLKTEKLQIFSYDIYRSGFMQFKEIVTDWYGVKLNRYGIQAKDMYNASVLPENRQYYANSLSGVENLTRALNLPVYSSFPHFLYGDNRLVDAVVGLHPNEESHGSQIDLEPQTGMVARATKRIQVNYLLKSTYLPMSDPATLPTAQSLCSNISALIDKLESRPFNLEINASFSCNMTVATAVLSCWSTPSNWKFQENGIFLPYGWVQEGTVMPKSNADMITNDLYFVDNFAEGIQYWCLIIAGICFAMLCATLLNSYYLQKQMNAYKSSLTFSQKSREPLLADRH